jgi:formylglycine-generating enzyme required for sulfatase activity
LRQEDRASNGWMAALHTVVDEETTAADAGRRERALILQAALDADDWNVVGAARAQQAAAAAGDWALIPGYPVTALDSTADTTAGRFGPIWWRAILVLVALVAIALALLWWQQRARFDNMVTVPAGVYPVSPEAGGGQARASLAAFAIDRSEVTAGAYRTCMDRGACAQPASPASATRPNYLLDRSFEQYPIININWEAADRYCAFVGKRLPTAAEWEVAAGYAPSLNQLQAYPWGEQFKLQLANSAATGLGDTQVIGSYRPAGDSQFGASDMAGNVAEWTASNLGPGSDGGADRFMVKGGSFQDPPAALQVTAWTDWESTAAAPWLGFRCAATVAGSTPPPPATSAPSSSAPTSSAPTSSAPTSSGPTTSGT